MSFKLIAIRPLSKCNSKFLKNLEANYIYQFYQNYKFYNSDNTMLNNTNAGSEIHRVEKPTNEIDGLYNFKNISPLTNSERVINVNISAVVGKNGSGKSSLLELLYVGFYKISRMFKIIELVEAHENKQKVDISAIQNAWNNINKLIENGELNDGGNSSLSSSILYLTRELNSLLRIEKTEINYDENTEDLRVEFIYSVDNVIYLLKLDNASLSIKSFINNEYIDINSYSDFKNNLNKLLYNLVVNYSLYGLNSKEAGKWIEKIFHKNDSYQTPIVLNPFRDKGNIDINSENYLVRSRLLSLLFDKKINNKELAKNKTVKRIKLSFDEKPNPDYIILQGEFDKNIFPKLYKKFFNKEDSFEFEAKEGRLYKKTLEYILRKITLIPERYPTFKEYYNENNLLDTKKLDPFIDQLFTDRSHITLKLRQALNFYEYQDYVNDNIINEEKIFDIIELENKINSYDYPFQDIIDLAPPSFFKFELYFDSSEENNFSNLSSGEKQKIFSLNSIIYHLRNLISVNFNSKSKDLLVYSNFNIILDEIELYYHPELQRTFISDLLNYLKKIDYSNLKTLPNLNIIFITHSPFILSDIPSTNILYLKSNEKKTTAALENKKSFGANIHELLGDNFFLSDDDIYIGEFAKNKINETIEWLNSTREEQIKQEKSEENKFDSLSSTKEYHKKIIEIIDEPIIKSKLVEMYSEIFGNQERINYLKREKKRIKEEIKILRNGQRNQSKL